MKALRFTLFFALLSSLTAVTWANGARLLDSVSKNLARARTCLANSQFGEAQAYAEMTLLRRTVRYCVTNDVDGVGHRAVEDWRTSLGGDIDFVEAPANLADLEITFKPIVRYCGRDVLGSATTRRRVTPWSGGDYSYAVTGSIELALTTPSGLPASGAVLRNSALHEIGHFLGLDDSSSQDDVMGPISLVSPMVLPSSSEVECLQRLRSESAEVLIQASWEASSAKFSGR